MILVFILTSIAFTLGWLFFVHLQPFGSFSLSIFLPFLSYILTRRHTSKLIWLVHKAFRRRNLNGRVYIFVSIDDPHSHAIVQAAEFVLKRHRVTAELIVLRAGLTPWAKSEAFEWALKDSQAFCHLYGFKAIKGAISDVQKSQIQNIELELLQLNRSEDLSKAFDVIDRYWNDSISAHNAGDATTPTTKQMSQFDANMKMLQRLGYYGPGVLEFEGEIYTLSRLHHLERRLLGLSPTSDDGLVFVKELESTGRRERFPTNPSTLTLGRGSSGSAPPITVTLFYSFRSPYSQLAVMRLRRICERFGAKLELRVLMPMVMRGLAVPFSKASAAVAREYLNRKMSLGRLFAFLPSAPRDATTYHPRPPQLLFSFYFSPSPLFLPQLFRQLLLLLL